MDKFFKTFSSKIYEKTAFSPIVPPNECFYAKAVQHAIKWKARQR